MSDDIAVTRRRFIRVASAGVAAAGLGPAPARGQARRTIKIGYVSPQTGPLAGFGETDSFVVAGVRKALGKGLGIHGGSRQPVRSQPRRGGGLPADPVRQDRPHAGRQHPGDDESGLRPVRGQRHAGHLVDVSVAAVVLRARRQARRRVQVDLPLLLGAGGHHRRLHRHVELGGDEQGRRRAVAQRRGRQRVERPGARVPARARQGRLQGGRSRALPEPHRRLLGADRHLSGTGRSPRALVRPISWLFT